MMTKDWMIGTTGDADPDYKWVVEHPDKGEHYFRTKREAQRFLREQLKPER